MKNKTLQIRMISNLGENVTKHVFVEFLKFLSFTLDVWQLKILYRRILIPKHFQIK